MIYDPDYREQFFWESEGLPGLKEMLNIAKTKLQRSHVAMPSSPVSKVAKVTCIAGGAVTLAAGLLCFLQTRAALFSVLVALSVMIFCLGVLFIVVSVFNFHIYAGRCTDTVYAVCVGYSISGSEGNGRNIAMRSPVFDYTYRGKEIRAFDPVYESGSRLPRLGEEVELKVDPKDPAHFRSDKTGKNMVFFIIGGIVGLIVGGTFFMLTQTDEAFRSAMLKSEQQTTAEISDDGRRLLDDEAIEKRFGDLLEGKDWKVGVRKLEKLITDEKEDTLGFYFGEDPEYEFTGVNVSVKNLTEAMKNAVPGDEFYYVECDGAGTIYSCKEYKYIGKRLKE